MARILHNVLKELNIRGILHLGASTALLWRFGEVILSSEVRLAVWFVARHEAGE